MKRVEGIFLIMCLTLLSSCGNLFPSFQVSNCLEGNSDSKDITENTYVMWKTNEEGMSFSRDDIYVIDSPLTRVPLTYEATIEIPKNYSERAGVIVGNYDGRAASINFEIYYDGNPRLFFVDSVGDVDDFIFTRVHVNTGKRLHLAIVDDPTTRLLKCYVDGVLEQTLYNNKYKECPSNIMKVGTDSRQTRDMFFKGTIYNLALFSSERNNIDLHNDIFGIDKRERDLLCAFELSGVKNHSSIDKLNGDGHLIYDSMWIVDVERPKNYSYSFAVVGDTQIMTRYWPNNLSNIYDYILEHKDDEKIAYCIGLGDITDSNSDSEWELAKSQIDRMNHLVPYALNRGNHDSSININRFFGEASGFYVSTIDGFFDKAFIENTFRIISVGIQKYIIFTIDYGAPDDVLNWASMVIEQHSECRVIISTHAFLDKYGGLLDETNPCPPSLQDGLNNGDDIWNKFAKKHSIDLILCGHDPSENLVVNKMVNDCNDVVTQLLVNPQGVDVIEPTGMIAMLYFSDDGERIDVRYYSTVKKKYLRSCNQFSLDINNT